VAAPLNIEIYVILIIITVNSIKVNYGWLCTLCAYRLHAFFHCWSTMNWKELSLLAVLGIVQAQTLTVTVTPSIACVPTPINPSV